MDIQNKLKNAIRNVPDFPKSGINFKDITPIMQDPMLSNQVLDCLYQNYHKNGVDVIAGLESRGFLFGYPLAMRLGVPFVLIRKKGKLPYEKVSLEYELEYGKSTIEMHTDSIQRGQRVLIHDDLLATGGSAEAVAQLITKMGGEIIGFDFLVELEFLNGRQKLNRFSDNISTFVTY